jgi:amino acid adenylation domain-containing protein/non-ribosomal peptide synthase protein (TIGR01720 family)
MTFTFVDEEELTLHLGYNTDIYESYLTDRIFSHFEMLITTAIDEPQLSLEKINYLTPAEERQLVFSFNQLSIPYPAEKTFLDLFDEQARISPQSIAIRFGDKQLTYGELFDKSNQLAQSIKQQGIVPRSRIILCFNQHLDLAIVGMLGILKSGCAYVPVDPAYPEERVQYILQDTKAACIVSNSKDAEVFKSKEVPIVLLDTFTFSTDAASHSGSVQDHYTAYIIYTSGSTGTPKGVLVSHQNIMDYLFGLSDKIRFETNTSYALMSTLSTDLGNTALFSALVSGATLHLFSKDFLKESFSIHEYFSKHRIDCIKIVPSYWRSLYMDSMPLLPRNMIIFGGEALSHELIDDIQRVQPQLTIVNHYGPTETTIGKLIFLVDKTRSQYKQVPIGKGFSNTKLYITNPYFSLCPTGVIGELLIGGDGVSAGYLNNEALTKERFVDDVFLKDGRKLYRTGDLVLMYPDGNIEFKGRMDDQVKIRGYRVELAEIEKQLSALDEVNQAVVIARKDQGDHSIVAYFTADHRLDKKSVKAALEKRLPEHLWPGYFVQLDALPFTSNGKVDKKQLPAVSESDLIKEAYSVPVTKEEQLLATIWSAVLNQEAIGKKDNFYNLGGESIKSILITSKLKQLGYTLKVDQLLRNPVLEDAAKLMIQNTLHIDQSEVTGWVSLTPVQHYFLNNPSFVNKQHYNHSVLLRSDDVMDSVILEQCVRLLIRHHDALRMSYRYSNGEWLQTNEGIAQSNFKLQSYDLTGSPDAVKAMAEIGEALQSSFDIASGNLVRAAHFKTMNGDHVAIIIHHLVIDGVSWRIFLEDFFHLYHSLRAGNVPSLPLKTNSFKSWSLALNQFAKSKKLQKERSYWESLAGRVLPLPMDFEADGGPIIMDREEHMSLDRLTTQQLLTGVHHRYSTEINDLLLTGLALSVREVFSVSTVSVKMEGHGRNEIIEGMDTGRTIGWFTSLYPLLLDINGCGSPEEAVVKVKDSLRIIPNKGIGYGILHYLDQPLPLIPTSIKFNYLGDLDFKATDPVFQFASQKIGNDVAPENTQSDSLLEITGLLKKDQLHFCIRYANDRYKEKSIKRLLSEYKKQLENITVLLSSPGEPVLTPSDLTFKELSVSQLATLNSENNVEDVYELSPLQNGIYYHWLLNKSSTLYFNQVSYRLKMHFGSIASIKEAYYQLIQRYAVLRTSFTNDIAPVALQVVRRNVAGNFYYEQFSPFTEIERTQYLESLKASDRARGFNLEEPSQMRLHIVDYGDASLEFIWSYHHVITDGWCFAILVNDFFQLLQGIELQQPVNLPVPKLYASYIQWLSGVDPDESLNYWKNYLYGYNKPVKLPFTNPLESGHLFERCVERLTLEDELYSSISGLCNSLQITQSTFMQSVWGYLLSKYNHVQDVVFGAVVSGRSISLNGIENMVGLFINTIPVRIRYQLSDTPVDLLKRIHTDALEGSAHHQVNLADIQTQSEAGMRLIDHILVFENVPAQEVLSGKGVSPTAGPELFTLQDYDLYRQSNYDFEIAFIPTGNSLMLEFQYNGKVYTASSVLLLMNHFIRLMKQFAHAPSSSLQSIDAGLNLQSEEKLKNKNRLKLSQIKQ